jgi:hypothetical protein
MRWFLPVRRTGSAEIDTPGTFFLSGHTQVDAPTVVEDRQNTDANRTLLQTYGDVITVEQHSDLNRQPPRSQLIPSRHEIGGNAG